MSSLYPDRNADRAGTEALAWDIFRNGFTPNERIGLAIMAQAMAPIQTPASRLWQELFGNRKDNRDQPS